MTGPVTDVTMTSQEKTERPRDHRQGQGELEGSRGAERSPGQRQRVGQRPFAAPGVGRRGQGGQPARQLVEMIEREETTVQFEPAGRGQRRPGRYGHQENEQQPAARRFQPAHAIYSHRKGQKCSHSHMVVCD